MSHLKKIFNEIFIIYRWVLIDGVGCKACDECTHALLNTTQELHDMIQPVIDEFQVRKLQFEAFFFLIKH